MRYVEEMAGVLSLMISLGTVLTVTLPSLRRKLGEWIWKEDLARSEMGLIREMLEEHVAQDQERKKEYRLQRKVDLCVLRDLITGIYYRYAKEKRIPVYALEDATALYELYCKLGGNSYVKTLFRQMTEDWDVLQ